MISSSSTPSPRPVGRGAAAGRRAGRNLALALGLVALAWLLYGPSVDQGILWDDPIWFRRGLGQTLGELLRGSAEYQFYRPLTLLYNRLWWREGVLLAQGLHLAQISYHCLAALLTLDLARRWTGSRRAAALAAATVVLFPFSPQAVTWVAPQQPLVAVLLLVAFCAYSRFQTRRRPGWWLLSLVAYAVAVFVQESAVPMALLAPLMELLPPAAKPGDGPVPAGRRRRLALAWSLAHLAVAAGFLWAYLHAARLPGIADGLRWSADPTPATGGLAGEGFDPEVGAFLLQAVAFPVARVFGAAAPGVAPAVLGLTLGLVWGLGLALLWRFGWRRPAVLASAWLALALLPIWAFLGWDYVAVGPRLVYVAVPGIAILWGCLAALGLEHRDRPVRWIAGGLVVAVLGVALWDVRSQTRMIAVGAAHLKAAVAAQAGPERRLVFINFPDRYRLRQGPYPLGYWGVTLAPVVQELSDYAETLTGAGDKTATNAMPPTGADQRAAWPYAVDMRGVVVQWPDLLDLGRNADLVFLSQYLPDGRLRLDPVGAFAPPEPSRLADFGPARLSHAQLTRSGDAAWLDLGWSRGPPPGTVPGDTVFVHARDELGRVLRQWDGDSWAGLLPPKAWPAGRTVRDIRRLALDGLPAGSHALVVGLYNRKTGQPYPIRSGTGTPAPAGGVTVGRLRIP